MKSLISSLFGVLVGVALTLCVLSGLWWGTSAEQNWLAATRIPLRSERTAASPPQPAGSPAPPAEPATRNLAAEEDLIKEKVETYIRRADDLERLLELLVLVSGVSAVALYLNALQDAKRSSRELNRIVKEAEAKFPVFKDMDSKIKDILDRLDHLLPGVDVDLTKSRELPELLQQEIPYYEMTVAASEYFNLRSMRHDISRIYHRFGKFHVLHSRLPKPEPTSIASLPAAATGAPAEPVSEQDLGWARFYFNRAVELDQQNAMALNDLGYLELVSKRYEQAGQAFEKSLKIDPTQQRARYNLAYLELIKEPEGDFVRGIRLLTEALKLPCWQGDQPAQGFADILYQRACMLSRLGGKSSGPEQTDRFQRAVADLETAFKRPDRDYLELKKALCGKDGKGIDPDLAPLAKLADQATKDRFEAIRTECCA
jgi:tetratricopeptide (TPR) repeat protein